MSKWVRVCLLSDLPPGTQTSVDCGLGEPVALFNLDGDIFALSDVCPHQGGRLSEGAVKKGSVYCPWHAWRFSLAPSDKPPNDLIRHYEIRIKDNAIYIGVPAS